MEAIKKSKLKEWLIDDIFKNVSSCTSFGESPRFDAWAKNFSKDTAAMLVNAEYIVDWADDEREDIPLKEASDYSKTFQQRILNSWG